jgi:hypothetical protein
MQLSTYRLVGICNLWSLLPCVLLSGYLTQTHFMVRTLISYSKSGLPKCVISVWLVVFSIDIITRFALLRSLR